MRILNQIPELDPGLPPTTVAVGTFDGVHLGHQALIRAAVDEAARAGAEPAVFTFDRHPAEVFAPARAPAYLTTPGQRQEAIEALGAAFLVVARFDADLRSMEPERFAEEVLAERMNARVVFTGDDFRFGRNHQGSVETLRALGRRLGYAVQVVPPVMHAGERISSSRIRRAVQAGDASAARSMLGRPYTLAGTVVRGDGLGRQLGFPTANVQPTHRLVTPADAVYAAWARLADGSTRQAAVSVGTRPTVDGKVRVVEAYLLDFSGDLYDCPIEVALASRVRGQQRFASLEALTEQMRQDVRVVREALSREVAPWT